VLAPQEVDALFAAMRELRAAGLSLVIITHKLNEARAIADRVTVLRGGKVVLGNADPHELTDSDLVEAMVGHAVAPLATGVSDRASVEPAVRLSDVSVVGARGEPALKRLSLDLWPASWSAWPGSPAAASASCAR
jgi:simple sugar transport system ATP-binding protein